MVSRTLLIAISLVFITAFSGMAKPSQKSDDAHDKLAKNLVEIAYKYRLKGQFANAETVLRNGIKILSLQKDGDVRTANLKVELARVIIRKNFHNNISDEEALTLFKEAEAVAIKAKDKQLLGKAIYGIGYYQFKLETKFWDEALVNLDKSLKIRREINDDFGISQSLFTIGTIHQRRGNTEVADKIYEESLEMAKKAESIYMEGENERHIGYQYYLRGDFQKALMHFFKSLEKRRSIGYDDGEIFALITIGQTFEKLGQLDKAKRYLKEALPIAEKMDSKVAQARIYASLGKVFYDRKENKKALISLNKAKEIAVLIGYTSTEKTVQELLTKLKKD